MSHQLTVVIANQSLPDAEAINKELSRLNLPCQIAPDAMLASNNGSFSAQLTTSSSKCQIQFEDSDWISEIPELRKRADNRDRCTDFILGSDMEECAVVSAIAAALSSLGHALVYYQPDDLYYTTEESIAEATSAIRNLKLNEYLFLKPDKFAKRQPIEADTCAPGWVKRPGCNRTFALKDSKKWDGQKHLSCGQRIVPKGQLQEPLPKKRWQFWK